MHDNLTKWRQTHLAVPAKLVLIKAVLLAKPAFWFRSIAFPRKVLREMEELIRSFIWGGKKAIRWVSWDLVCSPSTFGGMGLVKLEVLNNAYLGKHATTLASVGDNKETNQWKEIMSAKYGGRCRHPHSSWTGKVIWERQSDDDLTMSWQIGKGDTVSIWFDVWILPKPLANYPWTINVARFTEDRVSVLLNTDGTWNWERIREIIPSSSWDLINKVKRTEEDERRSAFQENEKFAFKSMCLSLQGVEESTWTHILKPGKIIPTRRMSWLIWRIIHNKLQTKNNLQRRNVMADDICKACTTEVETAAHIFSSCVVARKFWDEFGTTFNWEHKAVSLQQLITVVSWDCRGDIGERHRRLLPQLVCGPFGRLGMM